jgi:hypothetical protein
MGLKDWRSRRAIKDPVRGEFRPSGSYFPQPGRVPVQEMLIGVVTAPGIEPTAGEALNDRQHPHDVSAFRESALPALVDRADPARFVVLWQEAGVPDDQAEARSQPQQAAAREEAEGSGGAATPPAPAPEVHAGDDTSDGPAPDWAKQLADEMRSNGISGMGEVLARALSGYPFTIDGPPPVTDPTAGHPPAEEAARLDAAGEPATAVLTGIADAPVPQAGLPGPTASLCDLTLQVRRSDGRSYSARTRLEFPDAERRAAVAVIGRELPVRVDTHDDSRVAVDIAALDAQHPRPQHPRP